MNGLWRRAGETWSWPSLERSEQWKSSLHFKAARVGARRPKRVSYGCPTKPTQRQHGDAGRGISRRRSSAPVRCWLSNQGRVC